MAAIFLRVLWLAAVASASSDSINVLILGDWGGEGSSPYYTAAQKDVASAMNIVAGNINSTGM
jgi:hypothetical protein